MRNLPFAAVVCLATGLTAPLARAAEAPPRDQVSEVIVTAAPFALSADSATSSIDSLDRQALDLTPAGGLGEALSTVPGVRSSAFGAGASRPVVRGLAGPRVTVLTNGIGLIDASALSPDHQVASDPGEATRIEVLRGPAALLYGGSAIGGVVNIFDDRIARERVNDGPRGRLALAGTSVDDGYSAGLSVRTGAGPWVLTLEGLSREADDYRIAHYPESARQLASEGETPDEERPGRLVNSAVKVETYGAGLSLVGNAGFGGVSVHQTRSRYGVPGHAHADGDDEAVTIGLDQTRIDIRGEQDLPSGPFSRMKFAGGWADYQHTEYEGEEIGTLFLSDGWEARLEMIQTQKDGWQGAVGAQALSRTFDAVGDEAYVPRTKIKELGLFTLQRLDLGLWGVEGGVRFDQRQLESLVAKREFSQVSASLGLFLRPAEPWFLALSLSRSGRAPTEAELFASGAHAATRAFELGDPDLDPETALSLEGTVHFRSGQTQADIHLFQTRYEGFIDLRPTGLVDIDTGFDRFLYVQTNARFSGFEVEIEQGLGEIGGQPLTLKISADHVRASSDLGPPARIPPWSLLVGLEAQGEIWSWHLETRHVAGQNRVAPYELASEGYSLVSAGVAVRPPQVPGLKLFLEGRNLGSAEVREHVSFLKDIAPGPARNLNAGLVWTF